MDLNFDVLIAIWNVVQTHGWAAGSTWAAVWALKHFKSAKVPDWLLLPIGAVVATVVVILQGTPGPEIAESAGAAWLIAILGKTAHKQILEAAGKKGTKKKP